jgi:hypothetical protein
MTKFLFLYYGGKMPTDPKEIAKTTEIWNKWLKGLGKAIVDGGNPTMPGKTVTGSTVKSGAIGEPVGGYTIVQAENIDAAAAMAKNSPGAKESGKIAIYEIMPLM